MRISDWSSDVCSSDLLRQFLGSTLADRAVLDLLLKIVGQLFSEKLADLIRFRFECLQRTGRIDLDHRHHSEALGRFRRGKAVLIHEAGDLPELFGRAFVLVTLADQALPRGMFEI